MHKFPAAIRLYLQMGIITKIEEKLAEIVEKPFKGKKGIDPLSIEIALKKKIEAKRKNVFGKTGIPNKYAVILDEPLYKEYKPFLDEMKGTLQKSLCDWMREKGYEMYEDMLLEFKKGELSGSPFSVHVSYGRARGEKETASEDREAPINHVEEQKGQMIGRLTDQRTGNRYPVYCDGAVIGRGKDCDIRLTDLSVSERHARISFNSGKFRIEDMGSSNGTRVNRVKINNKILSAGDRINIGEKEFIFSSLCS